MTALVSKMIRDQIEYLAGEAEHWMARAAYWTALDKTEHAAWCMANVDDAEGKAMKWAERLECI